MKSPSPFDMSSVHPPTSSGSLYTFQRLVLGVGFVRLNVKFSVVDG